MDARQDEIAEGDQEKAEEEKVTMRGPVDINLILQEPLSANSKTHDRPLYTKPYPRGDLKI